MQNIKFNFIYILAGLLLTRPWSSPALKREYREVYKRQGLIGLLRW